MPFGKLLVRFPTLEVELRIDRRNAFPTCWGCDLAGSFILSFGLRAGVAFTLVLLKGLSSR
jgi:hypothetical protein